MTPEIYEIIKAILSAAAGAGLTLLAVAKFGQSWFLRKLDAKYAIELAEKNSQLMAELEHKKKILDRELQIEVTDFKSQLEVIGAQKSKFLEKKVESILLLNQNYYLAVKKIKSFTDVTETWVGEAASYFEYQIEEEPRDELSPYDVYREIHQDHWPKYEKAAKAAFEKYSECLALNMPMLPKELVEREMIIVDSCEKTLYEASLAFHRAMNFTQYIVKPEECEGTQSEFMENLKEEKLRAAECKEYIDELASTLFDKSRKSSALIENMLQPTAKG